LEDYEFIAIKDLEAVDFNDLALYNSCDIIACGKILVENESQSGKFGYSAFVLNMNIKGEVNWMTELKNGMINEINDIELTDDKILAASTIFDIISPQEAYSNILSAISFSGNVIDTLQIINQDVYISPIDVHANSNCSAILIGNFNGSLKLTLIDGSIVDVDSESIRPFYFEVVSQQSN
jgi:hypothetical protein